MCRYVVYVQHVIVQYVLHRLYSIDACCMQGTKLPGSFSTLRGRNKQDAPRMSTAGCDFSVIIRITSKNKHGYLVKLSNCKILLCCIAQNTHDYFIKVVPTVYVNQKGAQQLNSYQYTFAYRVSAELRG